MKTLLKRMIRKLRTEREIEPQLRAGELKWLMNELTYFRRRGFISGSVWTSPEETPTRLQLMSSNGEILGEAPFINEEVINEEEGLSHFGLEVALTDSSELLDVWTRVVFEDNTCIEVKNLVGRITDVDPYHQLANRFFKECRELGKSNPNARVLEIGSRARSGHVRRELVAPMQYLGLDILPGENTDIVGDVHNLSALLEPESFDALFSISTFEHLAMPWKAVLEMNSVLKVGGRVLISSHQAFPLHDQPWDLWRFSDTAWYSLFNEATGFKIIETALGEPASVVAHLLHEVTNTLETQPAYLGSTVLVEKVGNTELSWPVDVGVTQVGYPQ